MFRTAYKSLLRTVSIRRNATVAKAVAGFSGGSNNDSSFKFNSYPVSLLTAVALSLYLTDRYTIFALPICEFVASIYMLTFAQI